MNFLTNGQLFDPFHFLFLKTREVVQFKIEGEGIKKIPTLLDEVIWFKKLNRSKIGKRGLFDVAL